MAVVSPAPGGVALAVPRPSMAWSMSEGTLSTTKGGRQQEQWVGAGRAWRRTSAAWSGGEEQRMALVSVAKTAPSMSSRARMPWALSSTKRLLRLGIKPDTARRWTTMDTARRASGRCQRQSSTARHGEESAAPPPRRTWPRRSVSVRASSRLSRMRLFPRLSSIRRPPAQGPRESVWRTAGSLRQRRRSSFAAEPSAPPTSCRYRVSVRRVTFARLE
mmetsp:Transcript_17275/g.50379  ORF Transcript_17275/g.50379 Transcript_17275/m.50379 type:complete len:218 (+) Transcript_17275:248-901(+)